jgi:hypothetical protein
MSYEYQRSGQNRLAGVFLNDVNIAHHMIEPLLIGSSGVVLWGRLETAEHLPEVESYFRETIVPLLPPRGPRGEGGCDADIDGNGVLDLFDFLGLVNLFNAGEGGADCTGDQARDLFDFLCFTNEFNAGC